jgi:putative addiction module component (TIGR02574 family)
MQIKGCTMSINDIIDEALTLKPQERYMIIEKLNESLSISNLEVEQAWIEESIRRSEAYERGELETVSYEEVFGK